MSIADDWFIQPAQEVMLLPMLHHHGLVALSIIVAILTSIMALQTAGLARLSRTRSARQTAIATGAIAMGGGVWAMHFIGMLGMQLPVSFRFDPTLTLLSMLPSVAAAWVALSLLAQRSPGIIHILLSGTLMGAGIGVMHYGGMAAIRMPAELRYDTVIFFLSLVMAISMAIAALWVRFSLRGKLSAVGAIVAGGTLMGLAISSMHYTGMAATRIIGIPEFTEPQSLQDSLYLAMLVTMATVTLSVLVAATNSLLRYRDVSHQLIADQRRIEAVLNTAVDGIILIDDRGTIRSVNASVKRLFGWSEHELLTQNIRMLMPEPHQSQHDGYLARYKQQGEARIIGVGRDIDALHKEGHTFPIRLAIGRADLPGETLYVGFITDISDRRAMEEALKHSEQQYRSLMSNIPGVAFRCRNDEHWSMLFISDGVEKLTGYPASDFIQGKRHITDCYHPQDLPEIQRVVEQAMTTQEPYAVEYRLIDRDGNEHWILESGRLTQDETSQEIWIDGVMLDQTDNKLRNAEYQSKMTAISKAVLLIEFSMDRRILAVNDNFIECLGYDRTDLTGQHHRLFCSPDEINRCEYETFWQALRRGEYRSGEFRRYDKQGNEVWLQATYNPILDANGTPVKVLKLAIDITARRRMEEELRRARDRAEQAAAARSSFLANMSHEIRTPMNAIIGFTELLLDSPLNPQQQRQLKTVYQSSSALLGLLNDILDTAKLDKGAVELESLDFCLPELCQQLCDSHQLAADKKGLRLMLNYQSGVRNFRGDPLRLRQVITNLLGNAIKFTERGEVELLVSGAPGAIRIVVRDTGIGIPADRLDSIFDPFSQADASMSRRFGGTGLGTTISRQLVELMGGEIRVSSTLGQGTSFTVDLPLPAGRMPTQEALNQPLPDLPPLRILIADDVPQNIELLELNLQKYGHQVTAVSDGYAAVDAYRSQSFDLLILDVQMPGMDGLEASRSIRALDQERQRPAIPIIALTASVLDRDRQEALESGMNGFATKPLDMRALIKEMARLLTRGPGQSVVMDSLPVTLPDIAVDWERGQALWGDSQRLQHAIRRFLEHQQPLVANIQTLLTQQQWAALRALAHKLRGSSGNLGLSTLFQTFTDLEQAAAEQNASVVRDLLARIPDHIQNVVSLLPTAPSAETVTADNTDSWRTVVLRDYEAVLSALQQSTLNASMDTYLQAVCRFDPATGQRLQEAIDHFDFDVAAGLLSDLIQRLHEDNP